MAAPPESTRVTSLASRPTASRYTVVRVPSEDLAGLSRVGGRGYHSLRRQFPTELKDTPIGDLAHIGGWKNTSTLLSCYQGP